MNLTFKDAAETGPAYTRTSRVVHWLVAVLIIGMIALGWYMMSIEDDPGSDTYFTLHKSTGLIVLVLVLFRLVWRLGHRPKALPLSLPGWQLMASKASHWSLYGAMIAMPIVGLAGALLSKDGVSFFGAALPRVFTANHDLAEVFFSIHSVIAWILVALISLHVLAALKHLLVDKDGVFQRMWHS
ncbi:cytochrome b [Actimicrobium antarcticum]|uniref:Cytochrome b n=1 Tax=Actimicrobium antarcticum TaxID=1051899 RepID=A0ABP7TDQ0_9BURK